MDTTTTMAAERVNAQTIVIRVRGEVTAASVILDFSGLDYMNSGGIGLLVTLLVRANRQKQKLLACGLNEHYRQIFELTRLDEAIAIHDSVDRAVAAAKG